MTRAPSAEGSPSAAKIGVALLLAAAVGLYVSGYFFLWAIKAAADVGHAADDAALLASTTAIDPTCGVR